MTTATPPFDTAQADPADAPLHGATPVQAISRFFRRYVVFSGRASLSEFWWVWLFLVVGVGVLSTIGIALGAVTATAADAAEGSTGSGVVFAPISILLFLLAVVVPLIAVVVRRFHDANLSGLLALLWLIPSVGGLVVLILCLMPSRPDGQRFDRGAGPYAPYPAGGYGSPAAFGSPYGQPAGSASPYGQPVLGGSAPGSAAAVAHEVSAAVDAAPGDPRAAVAALAARRGLVVRSDDGSTDRLHLPDGDVVVRYDGIGRVIGVGTERR